MNVSVRHRSLIVGLILIPVAAIGMTGCVTNGDVSDELDAPTGNSQEATPKPSETEEVETAPVETEAPATNEADIIGNAQSNSGLSPERYQQDRERIASAINASDAEFGSVMTDLRNEHSKPVVVINYTPCPPGMPGAGNMTWGIAGALSQRSTTECGTGPAASQEAAVAEVIARAEKRGWDTSDYILYVYA